MTGETNNGGDALEMRRRRLRFRAWHRGMREVDLLLGRFADAELATLDETELAGFEALLLVPDPDVLGWVTGEMEIPSADDSPVLRRIIAFNNTSHSERKA
jgi:antitoxin CptB